MRMPHKMASQVTADLPKSLPPIVDLTLGNICSGESANDLCDSHITQIRYSEENI